MTNWTDIDGPGKAERDWNDCGIWTAEGKGGTQTRYDPGALLRFFDDEFFHITCHVDPNLKLKIETSQFVDLEKLLIKERPSAYAFADNCMGIFQHDGLTYFAPASESSGKITNMIHWEQAFRVYAAIYSKANPHRASEILQYIYVINTAVTTYHWNNVVQYDYTFKQLMSMYPCRSWVKTYEQGSNLSMRDSIVKNQSNNSGKNGNENTCWQYNRGKCFDKNCSKGDHHCSYCGKWGHGMHICRKKKQTQRNWSDEASSHGDRDRGCDHHETGRSNSPDRDKAK